MKTGLRVLAMLAIGCCAWGAAPASAAEHRENRWFMGADVGGGSAGFTIGPASADREIGGVFGIRGGYGFKPDLTAGLEINGWIGSIGDVDWDFFVIGPSLTWYPGDRDFFVRGTFGLGDINATFPGGEQAQDTGVGALASVGQELHLVRTVTFTVQVDYGYVNIGDRRSADFVNLGVGFAWYPVPKQ